MKGKKRAKNLIGIIALIGILGIFTVAIVALFLSPPPTNAVDFTLPEVNQDGTLGQQVSLRSYRGKIVMLEFMEPWCAHCKAMMPTMENLSNQYGKLGVVFISISSPAGNASIADVSALIKNYSISWPYLFDSAGSVFKAFNIQSIPTFMVIAKNGTIANVIQGETSYSNLASMIDKAG